MTTELFYLALTAMLTASLWIPYIVCQVITNGPLQKGNFKDPTPRPVPLWGIRANRVHLNAVESLAPFAILILIAHIVNKDSSMTAFWAGFFFWMRITHATVYWLAIPYIRTLVFTAGYVAVIGIFWELIK